MAVHENMKRPLIYKSPDGENCLEKTWDATKKTTEIGAMFAVYEMVGISKPTKAGAIAHRFLYWVVPAASLGAVFATTGCMVGAWRGKDDFWNHGIAGLATGSVIGARYGTKWGCAVGCGFGLAAGVIKHVFNGGAELYPDAPNKVFYRYTPKYHDRFYQPKEIKPPENY